MADTKKGNEINESDKAELRSTFNMLDQDGDGYLTADEIQTLMMGMFVMQNLRQLDELMAEMDQDKDGRITYEEFEAFAVRKGLVPVTEDNVKDDMRDSFQVFDTDGDGKIDVSEFKAVMSNIGMEEYEIQKMISEADTNKDGVIDYEEFCAYMAREATI